MRIFLFTAAMSIMLSACIFESTRPDLDERENKKCSEAEYLANNYTARIEEIGSKAELSEDDVAELTRSLDENFDIDSGPSCSGYTDQVISAAKLTLSLRKGDLIGMLIKQCKQPLLDQCEVYATPLLAAVKSKKDTAKMALDYLDVDADCSTPKIHLYEDC